MSELLEPLPEFTEIEGDAAKIDLMKKKIRLCTIMIDEPAVNSFFSGFSTFSKL